MAKEIVWSDRKRIVFGLPWTFTKYSLTKEKLLVETGILNKDEEEIRLYRIVDLTLKRSFWERLFGLGTIHCCTADKTAPVVCPRESALWSGRPKGTSAGGHPD